MAALIQDPPISSGTYHFHRKSNGRLAVIRELRDKISEKIHQVRKMGSSVFGKSFGSETHTYARMRVTHEVLVDGGGGGVVLDRAG